MIYEEGENNINVSVTIDNITINITIVINIEGSGSDNPSDGLHQTIEEAQAMGFTFSSYEDGLQIDSFENKQFKSEINVPEQIGDFKVISIKEGAFSGQSNVKKITLPGTIKYIGSAAFSGCDNLEYVNIPSSFEKVGRNTIFHSGNGKHDSVSPFYNIDGGKLTVELEEGFTVIPAALFWVPIARCRQIPPTKTSALLPMPLEIDFLLNGAVWRVSQFLILTHFEIFLRSRGHVFVPTDFFCP